MAVTAIWDIKGDIGGVLLYSKNPNKTTLYSDNDIQNMTDVMDYAMLDEKAKAIFPTDDPIRKVVFLSVKEITKKWTMPVRNRAYAYSQIVIFFADRFTAYTKIPLR